MNSNEFNLSKKQLLIIGGLALVVLIVIIVMTIVNSIPEPVAPSADEIASSNQNALGDSEREKWPIIRYLPVKNSLFTLGYIVEEDTFTINITTTSTYLDQAIEKLKSFDDDIGQYNIEIRNFDNPFSIEQSASNAQNPQDFIAQTFKNAKKDFSIQPGMRKEDYYYTNITTGSASTYSLVTYRIVLKYMNAAWVVLAIPTPVITAQNSPEVPSDIRVLANNYN